MLSNAFWGQMKAHDMILRYFLYKNLTFILFWGWGQRTAFESLIRLGNKHLNLLSYLVSSKIILVFFFFFLLLPRGCWKTNLGSLQGQ